MKNCGIGFADCSEKICKKPCFVALLCKVKAMIKSILHKCGSNSLPVMGGFCQIALATRKHLTPQ